MAAPESTPGMAIISYRRHRFPPVIIQHAIWLYLRYTLSYRDVEELLAERGLDISYESVRSWVLKFGPAIARALRRCRPRPSDSLLGWTAPAASMCQAEVVADLRKGGHPWTTSSELVWTRRRALSSMDAPCIASGSDELSRNVGLAVIYPALWRGR
jgi:hypothetical protein